MHYINETYLLLLIYLGLYYIFCILYMLGKFSILSTADYIIDSYNRIEHERNIVIMHGILENIL